MTTPVNPVDMSTSGPVPTPVPVSPTDGDIAALIDQLRAMTASGVTASLSQGVVVATSPASSPPTATITLSGSSVQIAGIRFLSSYTPVVNDTVQVLKQGGSLLILGHTADLGTATATTGGWSTPSLSSGFTTNGNSNGAVKYRKVMDNGLWKVQLIGAVARSSGTTIMAAGQLPAPSSKRSLLVPRDVQGGSNVAQVDIGTDGSMTLIGSTTAPSGGGSIDLGTSGTESANHTHFLGDSDTQLSGYDSQAGSDLGHAHGLGTSTTEVYASNTHTHDLGSATAPASTVTAPTWVGFNNVEYFL